MRARLGDDGDILGDAGQDVFACAIAILLIVVLQMSALQPATDSENTVPVEVPISALGDWYIGLQLAKKPSEEDIKHYVDEFTDGKGSAMVIVSQMGILFLTPDMEKCVDVQPSPTNPIDEVTFLGALGEIDLTDEWGQGQERICMSRETVGLQ